MTRDNLLAFVRETFPQVQPGIVWIAPDGAYHLYFHLPRELLTEDTKAARDGVYAEWERRKYPGVPYIHFDW